MTSGAMPRRGSAGAATPGPAVVGDQAPAAGAVGVVLAVALDDRGGIVDADLAVQGHRPAGQQECGGCEEGESHGASGAEVGVSNTSVPAHGSDHNLTPDLPGHSPRPRCPQLASTLALHRSGMPKRLRPTTPTLASGLLATVSVRIRVRGVRSGRVGGQRGAAFAALFQPPPSEPLVSLSISRGSPVVFLNDSRSRMTPKTVSAFRISRTLTSWSSDHLSPFAMWTALPSSDYYGDSVTLGLAPVRPSRVPLVLNVSSVT